MALPVKTLGPTQSAGAFHEVANDPVAFTMISGKDSEAVGFTQVAGIGQDFSFMRDANQILASGYQKPPVPANGARLDSLTA